VSKVNSNSRRDFLIGSASVALLSACKTNPVTAVRSSEMKKSTINVDAPFQMPGINIPDFTTVRNYDIRDFGASEGDKAANIAAFKAAIKLASSERGGRVVVPPGRWLCGAIHLKSYVALHLDKGAELVFSSDPEDYLPAVNTSWEGMECMNYSPLIYAYDCEHVAITGEGKLKADLTVWRDWYKRPPAHMNALARLYHMAAQGVSVEERIMTFEGANLRPHFIQFNRCRHVLIEDISIQDSPFWVLHPYLCKHVVIRRVKVRAYGHNNDGVDPEMTQNLLVEHCEFDQGDDAIAVKAGRNQDAWRLNSPCRNIVIRHCNIKKAHQLLAIGSELSGGLRMSGYTIVILKVELRSAVMALAIWC